MNDNASAVSGLSAMSDDLDSLVFVDDCEDERKKLKNKSIPKRASGTGDSFVAIWVKPSDSVSPQENLHTALVKLITVISAIDPKASFQCVYE